MIILKNAYKNKLFRVEGTVKERKIVREGFVTDAFVSRASPFQS